MIELLRKQINSGHLSELIPIKKLNIKDDSDLSEYQLSKVTYDEIVEKYPFLKDEPLYACKGMVNACYYWEDFYLFPINLMAFVNEQNKKTEPILYYLNNEEDYFKHVRLVRKKFDEGKGLGYISNDTLTFEYIERYSDNITFEHFMNFYTSADYGFDVLSEKTINKILSTRTEYEKEEVRRTLKEYKDEIVIYRGEADESSSNGYSYTLDRNVAVFFAAKTRNSKKSRIIKAKVNKKDVIYYYDGRNEKEVLVNPKMVYDKEFLELYSVYDDNFMSFMEYGNEMYQCYRAILNLFPYEHKGELHNKKHMLRVLFLGIMLLIRECPNIHIDEKDTNTLLMALSLHDIGRTNDCEDDKHGEESYQIVKKNFKKIAKVGKEAYKDEWLHFLMKYHCINDNEALQEIKKMNLSFSDRIKLMSFFNILKDADALDRVRFGIRDLDVNYLRLSNSVKYVLIANQLVGQLEL